MISSKSRRKSEDVEPDENEQEKEDDDFVDETEERRRRHERRNDSQIVDELMPGEGERREVEEATLEGQELPSEGQELPSEGQDGLAEEPTSELQGDVEEEEEEDEEGEEGEEEEVRKIRRRQEAYDKEMEKYNRRYRKRKEEERGRNKKKGLYQRIIVEDEGLTDGEESEEEVEEVGEVQEGGKQRERERENRKKDKQRRRRAEDGDLSSEGDRLEPGNRRRGGRKERPGEEVAGEDDEIFASGGEGDGGDYLAHNGDDTVRNGYDSDDYDEELVGLESSLQMQHIGDFESPALCSTRIGSRMSDVRPDSPISGRRGRGMSPPPRKRSRSSGARGSRLSKRPSHILPTFEEEEDEAADIEDISTNYGGDSLY